MKMLEQMVKNTERRSIQETAATQSAGPKTLLLVIESDECREVKTVKVGGAGMEELIRRMDGGKPILIQSRHLIGKEDIVNLVVLTAVYCSVKEPNQPVKKGPVIHLDEDPTKPWYFTHI